LGIAFPRFGALVLSFVPVPSWVSSFWIRMIMLGLAILIPLVVGVISLLITAPEERPTGTAARAWAVLKGYPYTLGLALTLVMMIVFVPFMKIRTLLKRWSSQHMPVIVEEAEYLGVVEETQRALEQRGWPTQRQRASWMLRFPIKVLTFFASGAIENLVAEELTVLKGNSLEVMLHPSDLVISAKKEDVPRARAAITEQLSFSKAYLTWSKEANEMEDRLNALWRQLQARANGAQGGAAMEKLQAIEVDLRELEVPYEEWEVLFRAKLLAERGLLQVLTGVADRPRDVADAYAGQRGGNSAWREPAASKRSDATLKQGGTSMGAPKRIKALGADAIKGYTVTDNAGEKLGKIEDFMIDPNRGSISFAVLSFGGMMGMGSKLFPVPWSALLLSPKDKKAVIQVDKEALMSAPGFKKADKNGWTETADREWAARTFEHCRWPSGGREEQEPLSSSGEPEREYHIRPGGEGDNDRRIVIKS
jgi:sporulation protein YlmC with PRC-barrel domain